MAAMKSLGAAAGATAASIEQLCMELVAPDTERIAVAENELNARSKRAAAKLVPELLEVLVGSGREPARQMAAVLLRNRVRKHWLTMPPQLQELLKRQLLERLVVTDCESIRRHRCSECHDCQNDQHNPD